METGVTLFLEEKFQRGRALLTWREHIQFIISDGYRRVNLMKALSSTSWGASSKILRLFYVAYVQSKMEYALVMFLGVVMPLKHKLKVISNICLRLSLRLILGARYRLLLLDPWRLRLILPHLILARTSCLQSFSVNYAIGQPIMRQPNCFKLNLDLM